MAVKKQAKDLKYKFISGVIVAVLLFVGCFIPDYLRHKNQEEKKMSMCEEIIVQETNNYKVGLQTYDGIFWLLGNAGCEVDRKEINDILGFDDGMLCPIELWREYGWGCLDHLEDWYPGKLTADGLSQEIPELKSSSSHDRFKELAQDYGLNASDIWEVENKYGIREGVILAILISETSGGKRGNYVNSGCYNYGNVGNNDRGDRNCYSTPKESIDAIGRVLNNNLLGEIQTLGCLSKAGSCTRWEDKGHIYASSNGNWERTMLNVLNAIYEEELGEIQPDRFNVRRVFTIYQ